MIQRTIFGVVAVAVVSACLIGWAGNPDAGKAEKPIVPSHLKAAMTLLETMDAKQTLKTAVDQLVDVQTRQPAMRPYKKTLLAFYGKHMSWDSLKDDMAKLYAKEFTEKELQEITAFCKTPAGKKMAQKLPGLIQQQMMLAGQKVKENAMELRQMILDERAKQMEQPQAVPQP